MAKKRRPTYSAEYRHRILALAASGRSATSLAKEFEPSAQTILNWIKQADLAVVLDAWNRKIVGWAMRGHLRTELLLEALDMALHCRRPVNVIHYSDQGCQYTAYAFGQRSLLANVLLPIGTVGVSSFLFLLVTCFRVPFTVRLQFFPGLVLILYITLLVAAMLAQAQYHLVAVPILASMLVGPTQRRGLRVASLSATLAAAFIYNVVVINEWELFLR